MKHTVPILLILLFLVFTPFRTMANAAEYYVDINGSDTTGDGSSGSPWETLHYAVSRLNAGDTLHIAAGTYSYAEGEETDTPLLINQNDVTIQGAGTGQTIIDGSNTTYGGWYSGFEISSADNFHLSDLTIRNFNNGIQLNQTTNTTVLHCDLHDNYKGVDLRECDNTNAILQNRIWDNDIGIYVNGATTDCSPDIINNLIYQAVSGSMDTGVHIVDGVEPGCSASPAIYHNTIDGGSDYGIALEQETGSLKPDIQYNNITGFDYGISTSTFATPTLLTLDYNNVWGHGTANYSGVTAGSNSISADPLYTNPATYDYHLSAESPCVDAAISSPVGEDLDQNPRPQGTDRDIGCYEHVFSTGIIVSPQSGLSTSENGGSDSFTVVLNSAPASDVRIPLTSSDIGEGSVSPASLTFTPANWDSPRTVTVSGVDDSLDDGDIAYTITIGPSSSSDGSYAGLDPDDVGVTNRDNDRTGIDVSSASGLTTSEEGGSGSFTVVLNSAPASDVRIPLTSSDIGEGSVSPASLTFTPANWDSPRTVTVSGVDDSLDDGDIAYTITIGPSSSSDGSYAGLDPDNIQVTNKDNNINLKIESAESLTTTEDFGRDTFTVGLSSKPAEDIHFSLETSDPSEGKVSPDSLTFTANNWNTPRTVTVTGVDDDIDDGTVNYMITISLSAAYPEYADLQAREISLSNEDNDTADIIVKPTSGLTTSQSGGSDTFTVVLGSQPTAAVDISLSSSDPGCGIVSPGLLTFTAANWNTPQTVTVTGQHNASTGDVPYTIVSSSAISSDAGYAGLDPADVDVTNTDNLPPDPPQYIYPEPFQVFRPGDTVTLRASAFADPEGDGHMDSHWLIARSDRNPFRCGDDPTSFDHLSAKNLTEYTIPGENLVSGMAYKWIVGYRDTGSRVFAWSDNDDQNINAIPISRASNSGAQDGDEPVENVFIVGYKQLDEAMSLPPGLTAADYRMLCCQHYIPDNPSASAVIGDDLPGGYDTAHYRIGIYNPGLNGGTYVEYPNFNLSPGRAVWFLARNGLTVDIDGVPVSITEDVDIPLNFNNNNNNGWNMIGPPNDRNYLWSDVEVVVYGDGCNVVFGPERIGNLDNTNPYIDTRLWEWTEGTYADDTSMMISGCGYWVRAKQKNVNLRFTVGGQARLSNPAVMLALALDKTKRLGQKLFFPETAVAGRNTDTPPAPMQALNAREGSNDSSGGGGNCFISVIHHTR